MQHNSNWHLPSLLPAIICYAIALSLSALSINGKIQLLGYQLLVHGWRGIAQGQIAWLANPVFVLACIALLCRYAKLAACLSLLAFLLGAQAFALPSKNTGGEVIILNVGVYMWLMSFVTLTASALYQIRRQI